jgi:hypothetical protein
MLRLLWIDGRFAWPLVAIVAYLTLTLIFMDYAWRVLVIQFDTLLLYGLALAGSVFVLGVSITLRYRAPRTGKSLSEAASSVR